jgi:hypothetical protein
MNATASTRQLRAPRWPAGLVPWRKAVQSFIERLAQAAKVQIQISGTRVSQSGEQITMIEGAGNGTATSNAVALDRWPQGLRPWKDAVDANLAKISTALHLSTESMQASARITVDATALHPSSFNFHPSAWRDWCKDTERTLEALSRATQRQLQLPGMRRSSGGDELHFERELPPREITLELELQFRWALAFTCARDIIEGVAYTTLTQVNHYENGSITETQTAAGGTHVHNASDDSYVCPAIEVTSDEDDEFDYGSPTTSEPPAYSGSLSPSALLPAAEGALENDGDPSVMQSFNWLSNAAAPTDIYQELGFWFGYPDPITARRVESYRYRWRATGAALDLTWTQGGSTQSASVADGDVSAWFDDEISAVESEPDTITDVVITLA